jgi:hypothetical protein
MMKRFKKTQYINRKGNESSVKPQSNELSSKEESIRRLRELERKEEERQMKVILNNQQLEERRRELMRKINEENINLRLKKQLQEGSLWFI